MTPALADLLHHTRKHLLALEEQVRLMELGLAGQGGFTTHSNGADTTAASIARTRQQMAELQAVVDKHDPEGYTTVV